MTVQQPSTARRWLSSRTLQRVLQACVTVAAFWYLSTIVDGRELLRAFKQVSWPVWSATIVLICGALMCGALRWWLLFQAFGALRTPALPVLGKYYLLGFFYNTFLPGGVSGDVVRGIASRSAWPKGSAGSFAIVVMERAVGLLALLGITAIATSLHPLPGMSKLWLPIALAFAGAAAGTFALAMSNRIAAFMPGIVRRALERLPPPKAWRPWLLALVLSLATQLLPAFCGYLLIRSIVPAARMADALVIVPLANAAQFLPITVAGAGVRETVFVQLYGLVGVSAQAALAASLSLWLAQAAVAAVGGIYVLFASEPWRIPEA